MTTNLTRLACLKHHFVTHLTTNNTNIPIRVYNYFEECKDICVHAQNNLLYASHKHSDIQKQFKLFINCNLHLQKKNNLGLPHQISKLTVVCIQKKKPTMCTTVESLDCLLLASIFLYKAKSIQIYISPQKPKNVCFMLYEILNRGKKENIFLYIL